jgi:hypothetical protein
VRPNVAVAVESEQTFALPERVMSMSLSGAHELGWAYWGEVERTTRGLVTVRPTGGGIELQLVRNGPLLLGFGPPELEVRPAPVSCSLPILGGLLGRAEGGVVTFTQERAASRCLRTSIRGFSPRLGALTGRPPWTGFLYTQVQARLHGVVGRRYVARLVGEARR